MNNDSDRADRMVDHMMQKIPIQVADREWIAGHVRDALEATEPKPEPKPEFKGRPAFIGDEVDAGDYDRGFVEGKSVSSPSAIVGFGFGNHRPVNLSKLTHPDGTPVSRVVPMPREIKESELLTFGDLQNLNPNQLVSRLKPNGRLAIPDTAGWYDSDGDTWKDNLFLPVPKLKRGE